MVKNTRTQTSIGTSHQPLNMPTPITVRSGTRHSPVAAAVPKRRYGSAQRARRGGGQQRQHDGGRGQLVNVAHVIDMWELEDEWWRKRPVRRRYWQITLETGQDLTVFQDLQTGKWYQQDY